MSDWSKGLFECGMAWSSFGDGDKVALMIPGGPGNFPPDVGWRGDMTLGPLKPLLERGFRVVTVTRKRNMSLGHSVEDMAADYAEMIREEFKGRVDLVIGSSYGGMIGLFLAANHAECFKHIVISVAACRISNAAEPIDQAFAENLAQGQRFAAGAAISQALFPDTKFPRLIAWMNGLMTRFLASSNTHDSFSSDILVEVAAERVYDATPVLQKISKPVLLINGDKDFYFPLGVIQETARLIPECQSRVYEGKGHLGAAMDKRMASDIVDFIENAAA